MARLLDRHAAIDGVIAANDLMALGAIEALAAAGRRALVIGSNGTADAIAAIGAGTLLATVEYDTYTMGCAAAYAALRHLRGEAVPAEIMFEFRIIDRANYTAWQVPAAERPCPDWDDIVG
jgi:ribose transport system substrate-binding protein